MPAYRLHFSIAGVIARSPFATRRRHAAVAHANRVRFTRRRSPLSAAQRRTTAFTGYHQRHATPAPRVCLAMFVAEAKCAVMLRENKEQRCVQIVAAKMRAPSRCSRRYYHYGGHASTNSQRSSRRPPPPLTVATQNVNHHVVHAAARRGKRAADAAATCRLR